MKIKQPSHQFRDVYAALMTDASGKIDVIRNKVDADLEELAVRLFGRAESREDDGFGPPAEPVRVHCWHCGGRYSSSEMVRAYRPRFQGAISETVGRGFARLDPLWWCKNADCDGAGFGHDIHVVKPSKKKVAA
ncbi:hypothetical protein [Rhizobium leguminosarum]